MEQLSRYLERIRLDPALADCAGVLAAQGQREAAVTELRRSLASAAAMGLRRTYLDLGAAIVPLLHRLAGEPVTGAYVERLLSDLPGTRRGDDQGSTQPASAGSGERSKIRSAPSKSPVFIRC